MTWVPVGGEEKKNDNEVGIQWEKKCKPANTSEPSNQVHEYIQKNESKTDQIKNRLEQCPWHR